MGQEAVCTARFNGLAGEGKALLETDSLIFRGPFRIAIPVPAITSVLASDGELNVTFDQGTAVFELGPMADRWAHLILNPKGVLDKLGVKAGLRVQVIGIDDVGFMSDLAKRDIAAGNASGETGFDIVFFGVTHRDQLSQLAGLRASIAPAGAIWVVSPRKNPDITERDVMDGARAHGLVDTKVVRFSDTHTSAKLVIPVAERAKR